MKKSKPFCRFTLFSVGVLCLGLLPQGVLGSAWTRPDGGWLVLLPVSYTHATEAFDDNGDRVDRSTFEMAEFSPLFEYGLTDSFTIGMQPKYRVVRVETADGTVDNSGLATADDTVDNSGLAESDFFVRQRLWSRNQASISVQGLVKVPIKPDEDDAAALGRDQVDAAIDLAFGNRHSVGAGSIFYSIEAGYRRRWELPDDEISANAFIGWSPGDSWSFILRSANTWGVDDDASPEVPDDGSMEVPDDGSADVVLTAGPSFIRHDAQLMASYRFGNTVSLVGGVSTSYAGENVGVGKTAFLAMTLQY